MGWPRSNHLNLTSMSKPRVKSKVRIEFRFEHPIQASSPPLASSRSMHASLLSSQELHRILRVPNIHSALPCDTPEILLRLGPIQYRGLPSPVKLPGSDSFPVNS